MRIIRIVAMFVLGLCASASAQQYDQAQSGDDVAAFVLLDGGTVWDIWNQYSDVPWQEFYSTAVDYNAEFAGNRFRDVPVGAVIQMPFEVVNVAPVTSEVTPPPAGPQQEVEGGVSSEDIDLIPLDSQQVVEFVELRQGVSEGFEAVELRFDEVETQLVAISQDLREVAGFVAGDSATRAPMPPQTWWSEFVRWPYWFYVALALFVLALVLLIALIGKKNDPELAKENKKLRKELDDRDEKLNKLEERRDELLRENHERHVEAEGLKSKLAACREGTENRSGEEAQGDSSWRGTTKTPLEDEGGAMTSKEASRTTSEKRSRTRRGGKRFRRKKQAEANRKSE